MVSLPALNVVHQGDVPLVLSIFPGIDLLGRGFEEEESAL